MNRYHRTIALTTAVLFALSLGVGSVLAAGDEEPRPMPEPKGQSKPPSQPKGQKKTNGDKNKTKSEQQFRDGYHAAYATIYDRHDYAAAISQLKALGHDDNASVANLLGYSYRKLGDCRLAQVWYERALKADPDHVKTWQYYGLWQIEQGNRDQAQYHLNKIAQLAGTNSEEYRSLAVAPEQPPGTGLVY